MPLTDHQKLASLSSTPGIPAELLHYILTYLTDQVNHGKTAIQALEGLMMENNSRYLRVLYHALEKYNN